MKVFSYFFLIALLASVVFSLDCQHEPLSSYPYCNSNLDWHTRATDLVARLTTQEKIAQFGTKAPAIDRLGIPAIQWWSEALHGVAFSDGVNFGGKTPVATSFPQIIGIGAGFNVSAVAEMAKVISTEARAFANQNNSGLNFFTPNINIFRDPRWGRGQETPGEDTFLTSQYVAALVYNLQNGEDSRYLKVSATCKHYAAYDLEDWGGVDRFHFNAIVNDADLVETYLAPFQACVREGQASSLMCSYNSVNNVPSCANSFINNDIARSQWNFGGFIVSDCGAIDSIQYDHMYTNSTQDTCAAAIKGGCDLDCGDFYQSYLQTALGNGTLAVSDLTDSLIRLFGVRIRRGELDDASLQPYRSIPVSAINTLAHQHLALQMARESVVLLGNDNNTLPFSLQKIKSLAVIGPNANDTSVLQGNYYGQAPYLITPLEGFQRLDPNLKVTYVKGCDMNSTDTSGFSAAVAASQQADATIIVVGLNQDMESEGHDRLDLVLPGVQADLVLALTSASRGPVILVILSGGPLDVSNVIHPVRAALWAGYPGQSGGQAIAEAIFGVYSPGGRLPFTVYPADYVNQLSYFNMDMRAPPGRTYKFYTGSPLFAFGHGISYTTFQYTWANSSDLVSHVSLTTLAKEYETIEQYKNHNQNQNQNQIIDSLSSVSFRVTVKNIGSVTGDEVVLAYVSYNSTSVSKMVDDQLIASPPIKSLFGFKRVTLAPSQQVELFFAVSAEQLALVDSTGSKLLVPSTVHIFFGNEKQVEHTLQLSGEPIKLTQSLRH